MSFLEKILGCFKAPEDKPTEGKKDIIEETEESSKEKANEVSEKVEKTMETTAETVKATMTEDDFGEQKHAEAEA